MDLEGIIEKIPSTEKILGAIWIISWICAIWVYHLQFFLTGVFCLFLIFILVGRFEKRGDKPLKNPPALLTMDKSTKTLTVQKLYENDLTWENHEICSGSADLPRGQVKEGDIITNCRGNIAIRHVPSNTLIGGFDFEE